MTQSVFKCPYCQFEIPSTATVCGYCTKDLAIVKPFMSSMDDISRELGKLKTELSELRSEFKNASATVHLINADSSVAQNLVDLDEPVYKLTGQSSILFFLFSLFFCMYFNAWTDNGAQPNGGAVGYLTPRLLPRNTQSLIQNVEIQINFEDGYRIFTISY